MRLRDFLISKIINKFHSGLQNNVLEFHSLSLKLSYGKSVFLLHCCFCCLNIVFLGIQSGFHYIVCLCNFVTIKWNTACLCLWFSDFELQFYFYYKIFYLIMCFLLLTFKGHIYQRRHFLFPSWNQYFRCVYIAVIISYLIIWQLVNLINWTVR